MTPVEARVVTEAITLYCQVRGALLVALHHIQDRLGYLPRAATSTLATGFALSAAEVEGVISFYHDFRRAPVGRAHVQVCQAEACQARGGQHLTQTLERELHCAVGQTRADGEVSLAPVYCLGNCALAPAVSVNGKALGRATPTRVQAAVRAAVAVESPAAAASMASSASATAASTTTVIYVPADSSATSMGANEVAAALHAHAHAAGRALRIVRTGSRGMSWLEPLVELEHDGKRLGYGPVTVADVPNVWAHMASLDMATTTVPTHPLAIGEVDAHPFLAKQERLTFARVGIIDPLDVAAYQAHGGWAGLHAALALAPAEIIEEVTAAGLRGRGGAAFPAGIKWRTVANAPATQKYIVCNADEGDSGTFSDRMLMEGDPMLLLEGMTIAGLAVGATHGYIYIRSEYPDAESVLRRAIAAATQAGFLGANIAGSGKAFTIEVRRGAGAYICGEETALLESLEGKRGMVRAKPPLPAIAGLFGAPTVVNNVITLATVPVILARGAAFYANFGQGKSRGTLPFQLAGNIARGGLVEKAFGLTLRELIYDFGGGTATGRPLRAVQVGGPLGPYVSAAQLDAPLDYEAFAAAGGTVGHGGVVVFDDTVDMAAMARYAMEFCAAESCGKCTPCRIGAQRGVEVIDRIVRDDNRHANLKLLDDLCTTMIDGSLCAMGGMTPLPVKSALRLFPTDFTRPAPHAPTKGEP